MFFKKKKIQLKCFVNEQYVFDYFKVDYANKFVPTWWKDLPNSYVGKNDFFPTTTMRSCVGFQKHYKKGIIIPLWSDLAIELDAIGNIDYRWQFSDGKSKIYSHPQGERGSHLKDSEYVHLKITSPWLFSCDEDIDWVCIKPEWNFSTPEKIIMPPGTVDFKYQNATNINFFLKYTQEKQQFIIPAGTPMYHIIPLSEREVELSLHMVSNEEYQNIVSKHTRISFTNKYFKIKNLLKNKQNFCPFKK
jgi:hypothetical protein